ncbi:hypothetical protein L6452_40032 [Arctium lappa]|uniref:Uncharacterized protein n=1 Tax=Arctium lappa TaxID=4217 RepID=A0ACB8XUF9_ARCLA|nr:hypothetical protein L6452_40032 [Arctium lappa]
MASCSYDVDTTSRLIQWSINNFESCYSSQNPVYLNIGNWEWSFILEKYERSERALVPFFRKTTSSLFIKHFPKLPRDVGAALIATFTIRLISLTGGRKTLFYKGIAHKDLNATASSYLGKMLSESIHIDIMICASDGSNIGAHRAILAARSQVFNSMFSHDLKEKNMSTINIPDMSIEALQVFLRYMYSNIGHEDFVSHRLELVRAADKYDVSDLKAACEESLLEDIDTKNVLERLQNAFVYRLPKLKVCCIGYLVKFGKIFEIKEEFNGFIESGDRELVSEVIKEVISVWEDF